MSPEAPDSIAHDPEELCSAWEDAGHRLAAGFAGLVGFVSLLAEVPPHVAALRGAVAWVVLRVLVRVGSWIAPRAAGPDRPTDAVDGETDGGDAESGREAA